MLNVQDFAHHHKNFLVIVCDPNDDTMFVSYRDKQVSGKIRSMDGQDFDVVKNVLRHSHFADSFDLFVAGVLDVLKAPLTNPHVNEFVKFLDAALYRISKSIKFTSKDA